MLLRTKFCLINFLYVLLIGFLSARKCVTDVYDVSWMMTCKMCIFCACNEVHLIFDFILSKEIDIFKPG